MLGNTRFISRVEHDISDLSFHLYRSFLLFFQALSSSAFLLQVLDADILGYLGYTYIRVFEKYHMRLHASVINLH